ncbi:hypothetical protein GS500_18155 [Rhodococcus hoagii]|nr:hypothetical protein [Prescottella equi]
MTETQWWRFVEELIGDDNAQEAAARAGFSKSNFTRWKQGARADPDFVVKLVRAYGGSVLDGLVAAGFITQSEASVRIQKQRVTELSDTELANELLRRAKAREAGFRSADDYELAAEAVTALGYDENWLQSHWRRERDLIRALTLAYMNGERDPKRVQAAVEAGRATFEKWVEEQSAGSVRPVERFRHGKSYMVTQFILDELGLGHVDHRKVLPRPLFGDWVQ